MKLLGVVFSALGAGLSKILVGTILSGSSPHTVVKPSQNKKGQKNFQLQCFLNTFSQLPAVKKYLKNGTAGNFFVPSYFDPALG